MIKKGDVRLLSKNPKAECIGKVSNQLLVFLKGQTADAYDSVLATIDEQLKPFGLEIDGRKAYSFNGVGNNRRWDIVDSDSLTGDPTDIEVVGYLIANRGIYGGVGICFEDLSEKRIGDFIEMTDDGRLYAKSV
jgi:hypothetical protein